MRNGRWFRDRWKDLLRVVLATLIPLVPSMFVRIPHTEWMLMASFLFSTGGVS